MRWERRGTRRTKAGTRCPCIPSKTRQHQCRQSASSIIRETHALCTSVDRSRQASRLPRQVETDVETEQVSKHGPSDATDRALRDAGKDGVAEFGEEASADSGETVWGGGVGTFPVSIAGLDRGRGKYAQPTMTVPAMASAPWPEVGSISTLRASTMLLKKNGTWTFNS